MSINNKVNFNIEETQTDIPTYPNHGRVFNGRYRLLDTIGTGGMGRVYKAIDEVASEINGKEEYVAIKVLLPQLSQDKRSIRRLQREAMLAQKLRHEHIVGVYDFDRESNWTYLRMEWLDGESLDDLLADEIDGLPLETIKQYLHAISEALSYAHGKSVIHRDIKPKNIFLTKQNRIVLIDFGLSQEARQSLSRLSQMPKGSSGTVPYMPPEALVAGHPPHIKDDIYGLAVTIFELLTGYTPFIEDVCYNRTTDTPLPHKPPQLDETQWQVLSSALAFNPDDRPDTVAAFVNDFCSSDHKEKQQQKEFINTLADKLENATDKKAIKKAIEEKAETASLAELQQLREQLEQQLEQEAKAKREAEQKKQAEARRQEQKRKDAERQAKEEAKRQAEEKERQEAERQKQAEARRQEQKRKEAERQAKEEAKRKADEQAAAALRHQKRREEEQRRIEQEQERKRVANENKVKEEQQRVIKALLQTVNITNEEEVRNMLPTASLNELIELREELGEISSQQEQQAQSETEPTHLGIIEWSIAIIFVLIIGLIPYAIGWLIGGRALDFGLGVSIFVMIYLIGAMLIADLSIKEGGIVFNVSLFGILILSVVTLILYFNFDQDIYEKCRKNENSLCLAYFDNIRSFSKYNDVGFRADNGLAAVELNGIGVGYADRRAKLVIPLQYDSARSFDDGLARVEKDDKWFSIDTTGRCVKDCP